MKPFFLLISVYLLESIESYTVVFPVFFDENKSYKIPLNINAHKSCQCMVWRKCQGAIDTKVACPLAGSISRLAHVCCIELVESGKVNPEYGYFPKDAAPNMVTQSYANVTAIQSTATNTGTPSTKKT